MALWRILQAATEALGQNANCPNYETAFELACNLIGTMRFIQDEAETALGARRRTVPMENLPPPRYVDTGE